MEEEGEYMQPAIKPSSMLLQKTILGKSKKGGGKQRGRSSGTSSSSGGEEDRVVEGGEDEGEYGVPYPDYEEGEEEESEYRVPIGGIGGGVEEGNYMEASVSRGGEGGGFSEEYRIVSDGYNSSHDLMKNGGNNATYLTPGGGGGRGGGGGGGGDLLYSQVKKECVMGEEDQAYIDSHQMPDYSEWVKAKSSNNSGSSSSIPSYEHYALTSGEIEDINRRRMSRGQGRQQRTTVQKPIPPETLPPRAQYETWKDLSDVVQKKDPPGFMSANAWSKKSATLTRQSLAVYRESGRIGSRLMPEMEIRIEDITGVSEVSASDSKMKDKQGTAFVVTVRDGTEHVFNTESIRQKEIWKSRIRSAILLLCVHGGLRQSMFDKAMETSQVGTKQGGVNPNIAEGLGPSHAASDGAGSQRFPIPALATAIENDRKKMAATLFQAGAHPQYLVHKNFINKVGFARVFQYMLDNQTDLDVRGVDSYAGTLLHHACEARDVDAVKTMLFVCKPRVNVNVRNGDGDTALLIAIKSGNQTISEMLLKCNEEGSGSGNSVDVNIMDSRGNSPLHLALRAELHPQVTSKLEQCGADINALDEHGNTPMQVAIAKGMNSAAVFLIRCGADINPPIRQQQKAPGKSSSVTNPLCIALRKGFRMRAVSSLLTAEGAAFDTLDNGEAGESNSHPLNGLHLAILNGFWEIVLYMSVLAGSGLVSKEALDVPDPKTGDTPLIMCARQKEVKMVLQLLDCGANPNKANHRGQTALHIFLQFFPFQNAPARAASVTEEDEEEALRVSAQQMDDDKLLRSCIEKFIFKNADFQLAAKDTGLTALHIAVQCGMLAVVDMFLQLDPDSVQQKTKQGDTALHIACSASSSQSPHLQHLQVSMASLLLSCNASTDACNVKGDTPLHVAVKRSQSRQLVGLLLNFNAEPYHWDKEGNCPIHCAVMAGLSDIVDEFIEMDTNVNIWSETGKTPVVIAVACNHVGLVSKLVANGASLAIRLPESHDTALHVAIEMGNRIECLQELLRGEVDVRAMVNKRGESPLACCERCLRELKGGAHRTNSKRTSQRNGDLSGYATMLQMLKEAPVSMPVKRNSHLKRRLARSQQQRAAKEAAATENRRGSGSATKELRDHYNQNRNSIGTSLESSVPLDMATQNGTSVVSENESRRVSIGGESHMSADSSNYVSIANSASSTRQASRKSSLVSTTSSTAGRGGRKKSLTEQSIDSLETWLDRHNVTGAVREKIVKDSQQLNNLLGVVEQFVLRLEVDVIANNNAPPSNVQFSKMYGNIRSVFLIASRLEKLLFQPTAPEIATKMVGALEKMVEVSQNKRLCQQASQPPFTQKALELAKSNMNTNQYKFWSGLGIPWNSVMG
eukprot:Nk52_evm14s503 gene=Nk52_evmTU14s503